MITNQRVSIPSPRLFYISLPDNTLIRGFAIFYPEHTNPRVIITMNIHGKQMTFIIVISTNNFLAIHIYYWLNL